MFHIFSTCRYTLFWVMRPLFLSLILSKLLGEKRNLVKNIKAAYITYTQKANGLDNCVEPTLYATHWLEGGKNLRSISMHISTLVVYRYLLCHSSFKLAHNFLLSVSCPSANKFFGDIFVTSRVKNFPIDPHCKNCPLSATFTMGVYGEILHLLSNPNEISPQSSSKTLK